MYYFYIKTKMFADFQICIKGRIDCEIFFQSISRNTVLGSFHETRNTFMKYFYFSIQHSLRIFLINKKIVFSEKRFRVKFNRKDIM